MAKETKAYELTDRSVTLAPYFKIKDLAKFKEIWQADYKNFAHKDDCLHYAFCFSEDGTRAHCREAYTSAKTALQHLDDVGLPLKAVLDGPAELERLELHGPAEELEQCRERLAPLGCLFYVTEWGARAAKAAMENDTVIHLYPYFALKNEDEFKQLWYGKWPETKKNMKAEKSYQYAFSFEPTAGVASCRESYGDADGVLLHLQNVDAPLSAALAGPADLKRLELHGPAAELEKLKAKLAPLGAEFFVTEWGFRNKVKRPTRVSKEADEALPQPPLVPAADGAIEMKVTMKKPASFYIRSAVSFLKGVEEKPAEGDKEKVEAKPPVENLRISGLGEAINVATTAASQAVASGLCSIVRVQTAYPPMEGSGRGCAQILIDVKKA